MKRTPLKRGQKPLKRGNKPLSRGTKPLSKGNSTLAKSKFNTKRTKEDTIKMKELFLEIWDERQDENGNCFCFETGRKMRRDTYREISACYDHVLEKQQYPEYTLVKKNIIIILPSVHAQKGTNMTFVPKIQEYREELLNLHKQNLLKDDRII